MSNTAKPRVLIAAANRSMEPISRPLKEHFELCLTTTLEEARSLAHQKIGVIVCGLYFDESRMFDFLRYVKADPATRPIPFISVKATSEPLSRTLVQGVEIACKALGAEQFVELSKWEEEYGEDTAHAKYRQLLRQLIRA